MSEPIDEKALEEYLSRGSELSRRYRELDGGDVPPELDRRVLEEARQAVEPPSRGRLQRWSRWTAPLALAASLVLVLAIVIESGVQTGSEALLAPAAPMRERQASTPQAQEPQPLQAPLEVRIDTDAGESLSAQRDAAERMSAETRKAGARQATPNREAAAQRESERARALSDPPPAPPARVAPSASFAYSPPLVTIDRNAGGAIATPPPPEVAIEIESSGAPPSSSVRAVSARSAESPPEPGLDEVVVTGTQARRPERTFRRHEPAKRAEDSSGEERAAADAAQAAYAAADEWLEAIRRLRKEGKTIEADREWDRFVEAYPNYFVAPDDIARKRSPAPVDR